MKCACDNEGRTLCPEIATMETRNNAQRREILRLRAAIHDFCERQDWATASWKAQPHVQALFAIDSETPCAS